MGVSSIEALTSQLLGGHEWYQRRGGLQESELEVCEAIANLPEFNSFSKKQQTMVLFLGVVLMDNISLSELGAQHRREGAQNAIRTVLKVAGEIGVDLTEKFVETTIEAGEKAWGLKKPV